MYITALVFQDFVLLAALNLGCYIPELLDSGSKGGVAMETEQGSDLALQTRCNQPKERYKAKTKLK